MNVSVLFLIKLSNDNTYTSHLIYHDIELHFFYTVSQSLTLFYFLGVNIFVNDVYFPVSYWTEKGGRPYQEDRHSELKGIGCKDSSLYGTHLLFHLFARSFTYIFTSITFIFSYI